jgi:hypothetical protein
MLCWFARNSSALQGMAAFFSPILAVIVIAITWRYVVLTKSIAETTRLQLAAALQPLLEINLRGDMFGESNSPGQKYSLGGTLSIFNRGTTPVKIKDIYLVIDYRGPDRAFAQNEYEIEGHVGQVLNPNGSIGEEYLVYVNTNYQNTLGLVVRGIRFDCTDLTELILHSFRYHPVRGMRHTSSVVKPPSVIDRLNLWWKLKKNEHRFRQGI